MSYLIDSDYLIDALNGSRVEIETLDRLSADGLSVSIITLGEVYEGAFHTQATEQELLAIREFLRAYRVVELSEPVMERFAQIRAEMRRNANRIDNLDLLIGVTALVHDVIVVTKNLRHFTRIPGLILYPIQDD